MKRKILVGLSTLIVGLGVLTGCGQGQEVSGDKADVVGSVEVVKEKTNLIFGACPGPYGDMIKYAIKPGLEAKGYTVEIKEFSDYVQPNLALANGEIDVNLFQHSVYLESFKKEHNLAITSIINVPTAGLGFYSNKYTDIKDLPEGSVLTVPNDPTNLRRALKEAQNAGLLTIDETVDVAVFSEKNIIDNPLNLVITPIEAAQLPRSIDSSDLAAIPGNFAIAAKIDLNSALYTETLAEEIKNVIAVKDSDLESQFVKDLKEVVESEEFKKAIESPDYYFSGFQKPEWYVSK